MKIIDQTKIYKKYKGLWVILDNSRTQVLSSDPELKEAIKKYYKKYGQRETPISFKVPTQIMPYVGC